MLECHGQKMAERIALKTREKAPVIVQGLLCYTVIVAASYDALKGGGASGRIHVIYTIRCGGHNRLLCLQMARR